MARFDHQTLVIAQAGIRTRVNGLSGWRCAECDQIEFDPQSAERYAQAGDELVQRLK